MNDTFALRKLMRALNSSSIGDIDRSNVHVRLLLCEFARRMLLSKEAIERYNPSIVVPHSLLFDISKVVLGRNISVPEIHALNLFPIDELLSNAYVGYEMERGHLDVIIGTIQNPYNPFVELVRLGARRFKYEYNVLEVNPFIRVPIYRQNEFKTSTPFWSEPEGDA